MVFIAIIALILGVVCGQFIFPDFVVELFSFSADYVLYILMFSVGISVGANKGVLQKIKEYHLKVFIIPLGIIVGTLIGGFVAYLILDMRLNEALAIVSGLGWYSLIGVIITDIATAELGTIAFLSSLFREILSFLTIPFIAKHLNHFTAIAPAAATSEDTTLPILLKYTSEEMVVLAVFNGIICSLVVPILSRFLFALFA